MPMMRAPEDPPHWDELTAQGKERPEPEGHGTAGQAAGRRIPGLGMPWGRERVWKASTHQGRAMVSEDQPHLTWGDSDQEKNHGLPDNHAIRGTTGKRAVTTGNNNDSNSSNS